MEIKKYKTQLSKQSPEGVTITSPDDVQLIPSDLNVIDLAMNVISFRGENKDEFYQIRVEPKHILKMMNWLVGQEKYKEEMNSASKPSWGPEIKLQDIRTDKDIENQKTGEYLNKSLKQLLAVKINTEKDLKSGIQEKRETAQKFIDIYNKKIDTLEQIKNGNIISSI